MAKKINLLVITHMYPTSVHPIAGIFIKNQYDILKKHCTIKIIFPYPYSPSFKTGNPYYRFSQIPQKETMDGVEIYHPRYFFFPRVKFTSPFLGLFMRLEAYFSYKAAKKTLSTLLKKFTPDLLQVHGGITESITSQYIKNKKNIPLIVMTHGEDVTRYSHMSWLKGLAKKSFTNAHAIITKSNFLKKKIVDMGVNSKKIHVIPSGYAVSRYFPTSSKEARRKLGLPQNKKIILFVGYLAKRKGVRYLVEAMKKIVKKESNVLCCFVGGGDQTQEMKELTTKLGLEKYILFAGEKKPKEVPTWMNACDLLVLPSLNEGLPNVLCEALACGKPLVATNIAGNPEVVSKDVGYLVPVKNPQALAEKIVKAVNTKWNKQKILKQAEKFSITNSIRKTLGLYRKLSK